MSPSGVRPPRRLLRLFGCIVGLLSLGACTQRGTIERMADEARQQTARRYLERFAAGDPKLLTELDGSLLTDAAGAELQKARQAFPSGTPTVVNLVRYEVNPSERGPIYHLTYQFGYGPRWILAHAAWVEPPSKPPLIIGLGARDMSRSLQEKHAFTFEDAGKRHYAFVLAAVLNPLFCLVTLIASFRVPPGRLVWLWRVFICLGFVGFTLDWTEGNVSLVPFTVALFGTTVTRASPYSAWIVGVAIPFGAIVFWIRRIRAALEER